MPMPPMPPISPMPPWPGMFDIPGMAPQSASIACIWSISGCCSLAIVAASVISSWLVERSGTSAERSTACW